MDIFMLRELAEKPSKAYSEGSGAIDIARAIKKKLNLCKLTNFKSRDSNHGFYSMFFLGNMDTETPPTVSLYSEVYIQLLSDDKFCEDLANFMLHWQPLFYNGLFASIMNTVQSEMNLRKERRIQYLAQVKAFFMMLRLKFSGIYQLVKVQTLMEQHIQDFFTFIDQTLSQFSSATNAIMQDELLAAAKPDELVTRVVAETTSTSSSKPKEDLWMQPIVSFLDEYARECLEMRNQELDMFAKELSEGVVRNTIVKAKEIAQRKKRAEHDFEVFVMQRIKKMREERRNRKHSEMVGEALRVNREIHRILKSGLLFIIPVYGPALSAIHFIVSLLIDRQTDQNDRRILVQQLQDEIQITDEKISMAEKDGDDKAKIELIRAKQ